MPIQPETDVNLQTSSRLSSPLAKVDEPTPRLDGADRVIIALIGLGVMLIMAAFTQTHFLIALGSALIFTVLVQLYGRLPRHEFVSHSERRRLGPTDDNIFGERAIAESLLDGIWIVNPIGRIIYANQTAKDIWGKIEIGQRMTTVTRAMVIQTVVNDALEGRFVDPVRYHSETPTDLHLLISASPIQPSGNDDTRYRHALVVFRDETTSEKAAVMQGDFLANASHELKTPIASLLGYIETLRGHAKDDPAAQDKFLGIMQEQAERMQRLISDLLSLRQIEQVEHIAPSGKADFAQAAQRAIDAISPLAHKRGVSLKALDLSPQWVIGHEDELVQLCINIIDNAVKMSPKGGTISVTLSRSDSWRPQSLSLRADDNERTQTRLIVAPPNTKRPYVVLHVIDEGPGFSKDHLPRIGERFYRVMGDRLSREKGTGLGLAIVKHIIMRHRGGLHVKTLSKPKDDAFGMDIDTNPAFEDAAIKTGTQFTAIIPAASDIEPSA